MSKHDQLNLGPSAASRWLKCKASPGFIQAHAAEIPEENEASWTSEGIVAHELAEHLLKGGSVPEDTEMADTDIACVQGYVDFVKAKVGVGDIMLTEQKVPLFYMPERNGKIDSAIVGERGIYIPDYKHGKGVSVEATGNPQLAIYGLSLVLFLERSGLFDKFPEGTLVTLAIYQPRARDGRTVRLWSLTLGDLIEFCYDIDLTAKSIIADPLDQPFAPDEDTCRFCPAAAICPARSGMLIGDLPPEVKEVIGSVIAFPAIDTLTPEQLGKIVNAAAPIKAFLDDAREHAFKLALGGTPVPGTKIVAGKGKRQWKDEEEAKKVLRRRLYMNEVMETSLISPAVAEKLLKAKGDKISPEFMKTFEGLYAMSEGAPTLVSEDNARPAIDVNPVSEFKNLERSDDLLLQ